MPGGRPPIPAEKIEELKEIYLGLLRLGKTEREIDVVEGMVSWDTRWRWHIDAEFSAQCLNARKQGVEYSLIEHELRQQKVFEMGLDDVANKPLVDALKEMGQHVRWKAAKLNRDTYGEKHDLTTNGKDIKGGMVIVVGSLEDKALLEKI
jgi:hypothetical protein